MSATYEITYSQADDWIRFDATDIPAGVFLRLVIARDVDAAAAGDPAILVEFTTDTPGAQFGNRSLADAAFDVGEHFVVLLQRGAVSAYGYMQTVAWRRFVYGDQTASDENMTYTVTNSGAEVEPGDPDLTDAVVYAFGDELDPTVGDHDEVGAVIANARVFGFDLEPGVYKFTVYDSVHGPGPTVDDVGGGGPLTLHTHAVTHGTSTVRHPSPGSFVLIEVENPTGDPLKGTAFAGLHLFPITPTAYLWGRV